MSDRNIFSVNWWFKSILFSPGDDYETGDKLPVFLSQFIDSEKRRPVKDSQDRNPVIFFDIPAVN
jgi:hypothetical protein